jgi:hypothetical protein
MITFFTLLDFGGLEKFIEIGKVTFLGRGFFFLGFPTFVEASVQIGYSVLILLSMIFCE